MGERLDILYERRRSADATLERPRRRERRQAGAAVDELHERRLLAGDEAVGDGDSLQRDAGVPTFGRRRCYGGSCAAARRRNDHVTRAERARREHGSVEYEMRCGHEENLVLAGSGLPLGAVDHHDGAPASAAYCVELGGSGELAPAATGETGLLDERDEVAYRLEAAVPARMHVE